MKRTLFLCLCVMGTLLISCSKTNTPETDQGEVVELNYDEITLEVPRTAEPPSPPISKTKPGVPPPPPPPPVIEEISADAVYSLTDSEMPNQQSHTFSWSATEKERKPQATEDYAKINENEFLSPSDKPLSTFSIDVDNAAYANVRRMINYGSMPDPDAVRIEEMINYFNYDYPSPKDNHPFSVNTEVGECPWNAEHRLLHVGLQGYKVDFQQAPANNLVFLLDVSGSMDSPNKLPYVKKSMEMILQQLRPSDRVAIVVYAGAAGLALPSTSASQKGKILQAIDNLSAGGSTAGGEGIKLAYKVAKENFKKNGNNRIILCTDGDFNVGVSTNAGLERLIEKKRDEGVFLTVLGFGMGNYKDSKLETLADKGNGNYGYIDNLNEAKKMLVTEMGGTFLTIAKDVKVQVEFNPEYVAAYRLIGYENRKLADKDFNDDTKDAGELGAGHSVTALYEIVPKGVPFSKDGNVDALRYQKVNSSGIKDGEFAYVKFRYKKPTGTKSILMQEAINGGLVLDGKERTENYKLSAAIATWGMLLRDSNFKGKASYDMAYELTKSSLGKDPFGYRSELLSLIKKSENLAVGEASASK